MILAQDGSRPPNEADGDALEAVRGRLVLAVRTKCDLDVAWTATGAAPPADLAVSARTGEGLAGLVHRAVETLRLDPGIDPTLPAPFTVEQAHAVRRTLAAVRALGARAASGAAIAPAACEGLRRMLGGASSAYSAARTSSSAASARAVGAGSLAFFFASTAASHSACAFPRTSP